MTNPYGPGQPPWGQPQAPGSEFGGPQFGWPGGQSQGGQYQGGQYQGGQYQGGNPGGPNFGGPNPGPSYPGFGQQGGYAQPAPRQQQPLPPYNAPPTAGYGQYPPARPQPPGYPPQPGFGWGHPPPKRKRSVLPWILGALLLVVAAAVVLVLGFVAPGWFVHSVFDAQSVEKGVQQTLEDSYRLGDVESVSCPAERPVRPDTSFDCDVRVDGKDQTVTVSVKDANGIYEVGHPK